LATKTSTGDLYAIKVIKKDDIFRYVEGGERRKEGGEGRRKGRKEGGGKRKEGGGKRKEEGVYFWPRKPPREIFMP
jgi:hypothetical protein